MVRKQCLLLGLCSASVVNTLVQPYIAPSTLGLSRRLSLLVCAANGKTPGQPEGPNVFGRPDVSRYENYYKDSGNNAIDADAKVVDDQSEQATNPFFVGYEVEELAMLWDVHTANFGERTDDEAGKDTSNAGANSAKDTDARIGIDALPLPGGTNPLKMGLHELILEACREADEEKSNRPSE